MKFYFNTNKLIFIISIILGDAVLINAGVGVAADVDGVSKIETSPRVSRAAIISIRKPSCAVKGNISYNTGNHLYHVPGMEDYERTIIDSTKGERWFCSESEAVAAGWRKAPR